MTLKSTIFNLERLNQSLEKRVSQLEQLELTLKRRVSILEKEGQKMKATTTSLSSPSGFEIILPPDYRGSRKRSPSLQASPSTTSKPTSIEEGRV